MEITERLGLPLLNPGQSQKEIFHNEALLVLDAVVAGSVEEGPRSAPPSNPQPGQAFIVAQSGTGEWAGKDLQLAIFTTAGWRFQKPAEGQSMYVRSAGVQASYRAGSWELGAVRANSLVIGGEQVVGSRSGTIAEPAGGTTIDAQARASIAAILDALRTHGLIASS